MENLHTLELPALVDMLATYTADYTRMLTEGALKEEFEQCKMTIALLQKEIEFRKETFADNTTTTTRNSLSTDFTE
jgi:hypothetical protein